MLSAPFRGHIATSSIYVPGCRSRWLRVRQRALPRGATLQSAGSGHCAQRRGLGRKELGRATVWGLTIKDEEGSEAIVGVGERIDAIAATDGCSRDDRHRSEVASGAA